MREMKDSGIEWIGEIPKDWSFARIGSLYNLRVEKVSDRDYKPLSVTKLGVLPQLETAAKTNAHDDRKLVKKGDFAINSRSDRRGSCGISEYDGSVSLINTVLYPITEMNSQYYNWLFHTIQFSDEFYRWGHGIVDDLWTTGWQDMKGITIISPPIEDQQKIAAYLDEKCTEIDTLISELQQQIDVLEEYKRSVITETVTKGLNPNAEMKDSGVQWIGKIPKHWKISKGKYLFSLRNTRGNDIQLQLLSPTQRYGVIPQSLYEEVSGFSAVKLNDKTDFSTLKTIHKGDYCISLRSFQGGFEYSDYEGVVSPAYQVFYPIVNVCRGYYRYLFKTQVFIREMNSFTMSLRDGKNIAFEDFGKTYIPIPTIEEQFQIAESLNNKCKEIDITISEKQSQIKTIEEYKKSLIFEYVTGKKEVSTSTVTINPVILMAYIMSLSNGKLRGKVHLQKIIYLCDYHLNFNFGTEYIRQKKGPYDEKIDDYLELINSREWFNVNIHGNPMTVTLGTHFNDYKSNYMNLMSIYQEKIQHILDFILPMNTSEAERVATFYASWNDLLIDGIVNPTFDDIYYDVINNWTPNKGNYKKETWKDTYDKMIKVGIIPNGKGTHTKK